MKTLKIALITSLVLLNFSKFGITNNSNELRGDSLQTDVSQHDSSQRDSSQADQSVATSDTLISAQQALQDFKLYLNKQIAKRNLTLSQEQIDSLINKSRSLIYENSKEGQISQANSRKIQKDFKIYLKTTYPENFKFKRSKNEVNYKLARRRIRATTKDFIINKLQIKNSTEIKEHWNKVKSLVYKKLDKAAYFNDFNELVVDESAIAEIIGKVFNKLEIKNASDNQNGSANSQNQDNPKRKRKAVVPEKISAPIAEKLVRLMVRNKGIDAKNNETLTKKIMLELKKQIKHGRLEKDLVIQTAKREINEFIELKNNITKKSSEKYLDRFIKAMGKVPDTNH